MGKSFNNANESSSGFVIQIHPNTYMDVKQIVLNEKARKLFKVHHILYLMILNMSKTNKINAEISFQEFVAENVDISRAYFYKCLKAMIDSGMITKLDKRGWYKVNHIKKNG